MNKSMNLQDVFLNNARRDKIKITVTMTNSDTLRGTVQGFDNYTVVIDCSGTQHMVYKHAIVMLTPAANINVFTNDRPNSAS